MIHVSNGSQSQDLSKVLEISKYSIKREKSKVVDRFLNQAKQLKTINFSKAIKNILGKKKTLIYFYPIIIKILSIHVLLFPYYFFINTSTQLSYKSHVIKSICDNNHNKYICWRTWTNKINERKSKKKKNLYTAYLVLNEIYSSISYWDRYLEPRVTKCVYTV